GFVVGNDYATAGFFVDAIDAADYLNLAHLNIEILFRVEDLGRGAAPEACQEILQLEDTLLAVQVMLVAILNGGGSEFIAKELDDLFVRHRTQVAYGVVESE